MSIPCVYFHCFVIQIISPFNLELTYAVKLDENKKNATVQMSSISVSVDPYTVNMLKTIAETASSALKVTGNLHPLTTRRMK